MERLRKLLLVWLGISGLFSWLPTIRSIMDGPSYRWEGTYWGLGFAGRGLEGDFYIPVLSSLYILVTLWIGWRWRRTKPLAALALLWIAPTAVGYVLDIMRGESLEFRGDSLGVVIPLGAVAAIWQLGLSLIALYLLVKAPASETTHTAGLRTANRVLFGVAFALLPVQYFLLSRAGMTSTTDQIGVLLTMFQWLLLNVAIAWKSKPAAAVAQQSA